MSWRSDTPSEDLRRAVRELWQAIVEETRLEQLVAWLNRQRIVRWIGRLGS